MPLLLLDVSFANHNTAEVDWSVHNVVLRSYTCPIWKPNPQSIERNNTYATNQFDMRTHGITNKLYLYHEDHK